MEKLKEIEKLLNLEEYKILKIEERQEEGKMKKIIYVESKKRKEKCPICGEYTKSIHDKLKPIEIKYIKIVEQETKINVAKNLQKKQH